MRLYVLAQAWGAICALGLCFFTPHVTTSLLFLLLVTTVYSDLFLSSFFLSIIIITHSILSCHAAPLQLAMYCNLHLAFLRYFPDPPSLSGDILPRHYSLPNMIYETQCPHRALPPRSMLHNKWPCAFTPQTIPSLTISAILRLHWARLLLWPISPSQQTNLLPTGRLFFLDEASFLSALTIQMSTVAS